MNAIAERRVSGARMAAAVLFAVMLGVVCLGFASVGQAHAQIRSVYVNGEDIVEGGTIECTSGTATYNTSTKTLTLNKALVDVNKGFQNILITGNSNDTVKVVLKGASTIDYTGSGFGTGLSSTPNLVFSGSGSLKVVNAHSGIKSSGNITVRSGKFTIDAGNSGFICSRFTMSGGKLTSVAGGNYAVSAKRMSNKPERLGYINGRLPVGAKFKKAKSSYTVDGSKSVTLTKYANASKTPKVNSVTFGYTYDVDTVAARAFANAKVTKVTLGENVKQVNGLAFYKTKSLTRLNVTNYRWLSKTKFAYKALTSAGKSSGKKLVVKVETTDSASTVKSTLRAAGLSKYAKVKTNSRRVSTASAAGAGEAAATPLGAAAMTL